MELKLYIEKCNSDGYCSLWPWNWWIYLTKWVNIGIWGSLSQTLYKHHRPRYRVTNGFMIWNYDRMQWKNAPYRIIMSRYYGWTVHILLLFLPFTCLVHVCRNKKLCRIFKGKHIHQSGANCYRKTMFLRRIYLVQLAFVCVFDFCKFGVYQLLNVICVYFK